MFAGVMGVSIKQAMQRFLDRGRHDDIRYHRLNSIITDRFYCLYFTYKIAAQVEHS